MPTLFCRDCKWSRPRKVTRGSLWARVVEDYEFANCAQPTVMGAHFLVHPASQSHEFCSTQRKFNHPDTCGHDGKFWEAKP